ncbi:hypothetical protein DPX16_13511 [Anabarilius grahami]|uniref:Uncharacterized protein n=1 Tax=Anabarilius grahami TaxID=495550 RepID=A0A3N0YCN5_ANAGA|nr:hypothetical protein DPX16_13511 [Anabarilius grahami]
MEAAVLMDRKELLVEPSSRSPFLNALSRQLQPTEKRVPNTQQLRVPNTQQLRTHTTARGALAAGCNDVKHERHRHPLVLASPGEAEREYNSLKPPNELICEPYDCSHRYALAQTGPESPGTDANTSSLGKSAKRERRVPIGRHSQ